MDHFQILFYTGFIIGIHLTMLLVCAFGKLFEKTLFPKKKTVCYFAV